MKGPEWFASIGTERSTGPKVFCVSGHVNRGGNFELPLGVSLREIIFEHAGGVLGDREIKAIIPGGASTPVLTREHLDIPMAFETLADVGSALGTGAITVLHDGTCMVDVARQLMKFFVHESCGRCTPCRVGTLRMYEILNRMENGEGRDGDIESLEQIASTTIGNTFCPMGDAAVNPILSGIKNFRGEYEYHISHKKCMV
jgi:NADH-quinone oxidoreductase subunit F